MASLLPTSLIGAHTWINPVFVATNTTLTRLRSQRYSYTVTMSISYSHILQAMDLHSWPV
jgi:hypothetical protein